MLHCLYNSSEWRLFCKWPPTNNMSTHPRERDPSSVVLNEASSFSLLRFLRFLLTRFEVLRIERVVIDIESRQRQIAFCDFRLFRLNLIEQLLFISPWNPHENIRLELFGLILRSPSEKTNYKTRQLWRRQQIKLEASLTAGNQRWFSKWVWFLPPRGWVDQLNS